MIHLGTPVLILPDDHTQTEARGVVTGHHKDWLFVKTDDDEELVHSDLVVPLAFEIGPMGVAMLAMCSGITEGM